MDWLCRGSNSSSLWQSECFYDWINVVSALCSMYISLLLIAYLRWAQHSRRRSGEEGKCFAHNIRNILGLFLLLTHGLEMTDGLLSQASASVIAVPSASVGLWVSSLIVSHLLETTSRSRFFYLTAPLLAVNSFARLLRLSILLHNEVPLACIRPVTAILSAGIYFLLAVAESLTAYVERSKIRSKNIPLTTTSRYKHDRAHFISKATFHWLTPLLRAGYSCPLEAEDLGALPEMHRSKTQLKRFDDIYKEQVVDSRRGCGVFWRTCWLFTRSDFLWAGLLKLLGDVLSLVPSLGIAAFVQFMSTETEPVAVIWVAEYARISEVWTNGWVVTAVVLVACVAQSTCSQTSTHLLNIQGIHLNAVLQGKIYTKSLRVSRCQQEERGKEEDGSVTHLLTEDATNIMSALWVAHYLWAIPLKIALIIMLLYRFLGSSALIGCLVAIVTLTPLQVIIGRKMSQNSTKLSDMTDERIHLVGSLMENIKLLKMLGWEQLFATKIQNVRLMEEKKLNVDSALWCAMTLLTQISSILMAVLTLGTHSVIGNEPLSAATIFTALALFNQLTVPLFIFPVTVPIFISAAVSGKRIAQYLEQPEIANVLPAAAPVPDSARKFVPCFAEQFSCTNSYADITSITEPFNEETFGIELDTLASQAGDDFNAPSEPSTVDAVTIEGVFSWPGGWKLDLNKVIIPKGRLTIVVGSVGSGKSSLLSAILGEMTQERGSVQWRPGNTVAYAGQTPWLVNATIKDNITFGGHFSSKRYTQVIEACALKPDLDILPDRDLTEVGDRGIKLSGGQKQRIAVARALYSQANFVILDDPLSSLDQAVATTVFETGIKRLLRRGKRTVLLVTHNLNLLPYSHKVIVMERGRIRIQGELNDIETLDTALIAGWRAAVEGAADGSDARTAGERWNLVRLVTSISLQLQHNAADPQQEQESTFHRRQTSRRRPALMEWSFLSNDLPGDAEEAGVLRPAGAWRCTQNNGRQHRIARAFSLQAGRHGRVPITRQMSSPHVLNIETRRRGNSLLRPMKKRMLAKKPEQPQHKPLQRLSSNESGFSDAKSEIDPNELNDLDVGAHGSSSEERQYGTVAQEVIVMYVAACGGALTAFYVLACLLSQIVRVLTDYWISNCSDSPENTEGASSYLWIYNALSLATLLLSLAAQWAGQTAGARARSHIHDTLLKHVSKCTIAAVAAIPSGRFINRFSTDITVIDKKLATCIQRLVQFLLMCASAVVVNAVVTPWFLLAGIPLCLLYYCVQHFYRASSRELQRLDGISRSPVVSHLVETISGVATIRAYGYQQKFTSAFLAKLDQHCTAFILLNASNRWLGIVLDYLGGGCVCVAMVTALAATRVAPGSVSPALAGLAVNYTLLVPIYLNWVVKFLSECEMYLGAVERIHQVLQLPTEMYQSSIVDKDQKPQNGDIKFENVTLRYSDTTEPVFIGLNLHIPAGQKVGICGRSGSGKSTLMLSLLRLLEPTSGRLLLGGSDITRISHAMVRQNIAVVPQDAALLPGTVRENLDPYHEKTDSIIWTALDAVKLSETIRSADGLDNDMSAIGLSSGERQLLCVARALLRPSQVLVMDEASSSLDDAAEALLMSAAWNSFAARTIIVIAHRLSTLLSCDRILVIDRGRIAEDGSPQQLLQRQMGLFATMLRASQHNETNITVLPK